MAPVPFHVHYELTRRQRLAAQLESWSPCLAACLGFTLGVAFLGSVVDRRFLLLLPLPVIVTRKFFAWLVTLAHTPTCPVDVTVETTGLGVRVGDDFTRLPLDGLIQVCKADGGWQVIHANGTVLTVPAAAITDGQLDFLKAVARQSAERRRRPPEPSEAT
jgi:hypothetical protein